MAPTWASTFNLSFFINSLHSTTTTPPIILLFSSSTDFHSSFSAEEAAPNPSIYGPLMAPLFPISVSSLLFLFLPLFFSGVHAATFTITNNCAYIVWPGVLANAGTAPLSTTGFGLKQGETVALAAPAGWSGRFWVRTLCSTDSTGKFSCVTGDCGSGAVECNGGGAKPPATLAEFTLGNGALDFYDVSLVDGFNAPMMVTPVRGTGNCAATGCLADLNGACPTALRVAEPTSGEGVACKSACEAFRDPRYCCSGSYGTADTCGPTDYSRFFKSACPRAYSYAYDDRTSTFTCSGADYLITFCPSVPSQKSSSNQYPSINNTMMFSSVPNSDVVSGAVYRHGRISLLWLVAATIFLMLTWTCQH